MHAFKLLSSLVLLAALGTTTVLGDVDARVPAKFLSRRGHNQQLDAGGAGAGGGDGGLGANDMVSGPGKNKAKLTYPQPPGLNCGRFPNPFYYLTFDIPEGQCYYAGQKVRISWTVKADTHEKGDGNRGTYAAALFIQREDGARYTVVPPLNGHNINAVCVTDGSAEIELPSVQHVGGPGELYPQAAARWGLLAFAWTELGAKTEILGSYPVRPAQASRDGFYFAPTQKDCEALLKH